MENEQKPLTEPTTVEPTKPVENVGKTYTQAEVDDLMKNRFTQEQVNKMIEQRLNREKKPVKVDQKAEPKPAVTPQVSQTVNNEELTKVRTQLRDTQIQLAKYEKESALAGYQIDEDYKEFVNYKVLRLVNKDKDYKTALAEFMQGEGQKYLSNGGKISMPRPKNTGTVDDTQSVTDKMRKAMGLK